MNNSSFLDIQNRFSPIYYKKIYDSSIEKYDTTIVDLPDSPFLDVVPFTLDYVDIVFFVINPNFISIRQAIKKLELMTKIWKIPVNKIYIVINNKKSSSLEISQIEMLLKGYHILCEIESSDLVEKVINGMSEISLDNVKNIENIINVLCNNKKSNTNNYEEINIRNKLSKKISEIFGVKTSVN